MNEGTPTTRQLAASAMLRWSGRKTSPCGDRAWHINIACCWLVLVLSCASFGQSVERPVSQWQHTGWTAKDGAPSQISQLAQTTDGYLWIGSTQGLFQFDGLKFERYEPQPGVKLPSYNIYSMLATPDGGLWVAFRPGGLAFIKHGVITILDGPADVTKVEVFCLARDQDGRIWAGTRKGLWLYDGVHWTRIAAEWNLEPREISTMLVDREGTLWVVTNGSIYSLQKGSKTFQTTGLHLNFVALLAQAPDGRIWYDSGDFGVGKIPVSGKVEKSYLRTKRTNITRLFWDDEGDLWIADSLEGVSRSSSATQHAARRSEWPTLSGDFFRDKDGLSSNHVVNFFEDREGDIWVSTIRGLDRFRRTPLVPVKLPNPYEKLTLLAGQHGDIWVGSTPRALRLLHIRNGSVQILGRNSFAAVASVYRASDGVTWWGCLLGIMRQSGDSFRFYKQPANEKPDFMWAILTGGDDGGLWTSFGDIGLLYFHDGRWERRASPAGLPDRGPSATFTDRDGGVWLGYTENRVRLLKQGKVAASYSANDGISIGRVKVISGPGPHLWFGGELGLALFQNGRFSTLNIAGPEQLGTVSGIIEAKDGSLWLNEMRGIIRIGAEEVSEILANPRHVAKFRLYDFMDGLRGLPQMNFTASTAVEASDGRLWFATDDGLVWIDPRNIQKNMIPPPVSVVSIASDREHIDTTKLGASGVSFAAGTRQLEIDYAGLSLSVPERVQFRYRLDRVDAEWQSAGNRRQAFYTNLRPGDYRFRVTACNEDGVCNEQGTTLDFKIAPAFYQTRWFTFFWLFVALGLVWTIYSIRLSYVTVRIRDRAEERAFERVRIARDLHDTLLQSFHGLLLKFQTSYDLLPTRPEEARQTLGRSIDQADAAITEGRDAVRGLRSFAAETNDVAGSLRDIAADIASEGNRIGAPIFRLEVEGAPRSLHPIRREEIYGVAREALRNAFRHAEARNIAVHIKYGVRQFQLDVKDDGKGIDPSVLAGDGLTGHYGLHGMRERAQVAGGRLEVESQIGFGTRVALAIPSSIAYAGASRRLRLPAWLSGNTPR